MMAWQGIELVQEDLARLRPALLAWLNSRFAFSQGEFWPASSRGGLLPALELSTRQRQRANAALARGEAFWDRIGLQALVPVYGKGGGRSHSQSLGILVLSGVDWEVGPEEALRWLPLFQAAVSDRLLILKQTALRAKQGDVPQYVVWAMEARSGQGPRPAALLHVMIGDSGAQPWQAKEAVSPSGKSSCRGTLCPEEMMALCQEIWPGSAPEWYGGSDQDAWFLLEIQADHLASGFRHLGPMACRMGLPHLRAYGIPLSSDKSSGEHLAGLSRVEAAASELDTAFLSQPDLDSWEARLALTDVGRVLAEVRKAARGRAGCMVAYALLPAETMSQTKVRRRPRKRISQPPDPQFPEALAAYMGPSVISVAAGRQSGFLIRRLSSRSKRQQLEVWHEEIRCACQAVWECVPTLGLAASWQPSVGRSSAGLAALKAFVHSLFFGQGAAVTLDAVTWNISGDELLAWGDLLGACSEYRKGLKLDLKSANLHNSLGVCLAELGMHRRAHQAFATASTLDAEDFMACYNLAGSWLAQGDLAKAEGSLRQAMAIQPADCRVASRLAEVLLQMGRPIEAAGLLEDFTRKEDGTTSSTLWRLLGKAYLAQDRWNAAQEAWKQALKRHPDDAETLAHLALGYLEAVRDGETAARLGHQAEVRAGCNDRVLGLLARLYVGLGDQDGLGRIRSIKRRRRVGSVGWRP